MKKKVLLISALALGMVSTYGQNWESVSESSRIGKHGEKDHSYRVDLKSFRNLLKETVETGTNAKPVIISLPTAEGTIEKFAVYSNPVMEKSLAEKYELGSYVGVGIDDPGKYLRFSTSPAGMESMIIKDGKFQFIEPAGKNQQTYRVFYKENEKGEIGGFQCDTPAQHFEDFKALAKNGKNKLSGIDIASRPTNTRYRTLRLAMATTSEYTAYHGGTAGALAAINTTITTVNGVFERDFGVHLQVLTIPEIIRTAADPYFNVGLSNPNFNQQLQTLLTETVNNRLNDNDPNNNISYDIGHVLHRNLGGSRNGMAGSIGGICTEPTAAVPLAKGSAFTMSPEAAGQEFDLTVAHEMGHQLGANHTFSVRGEGFGANVEPGGGTTIMGYAGITDNNVQDNADGYFHYKSIAQVLNNLESKNNCGVSQAIVVNTAPVITPLARYSIPKGTAYYLEAVATDAQNDGFTYTWEQYDSVGAQNTISGDSGWGYNPEGGLARSFPGTVTGRRYFPKLETVMNGSLTDKPGWETVSYIPRVLNYAVTLRDNNAQRPMTSTSETVITVGNHGPFKFNGLTASSVLYNNASNTIYWDVVNTNAAPYNVTNVKIDYTTDNGATWTNLVASTPNTGSYSAQMPANLTGAVKLRISAIGNVFYAVSPAVTVGSVPTSITVAPTGVSAIDAEIFKTTARISWNRIPGATYSINYRKTGTTNWQNTISQTNSVILNNLEDETNYEVQVAGVVNTVAGAFSNNYTFKTKGLKTGIDYCILKSGIPDYSPIYSVTVANITQPRMDVKNRAYRDFSEDPNKIVQLNRGSQYTLRVETAIPDSYSVLAAKPVRFNVWIDYNRDGVFAASERVLSLGGNNLPILTYIPASGSFTVPNTAYAGDKLLRMRVVVKYENSDVEDVCGSISGGGIMDFPVRISNNNAGRDALAVNEARNADSEVSIYPNPADTFVEVKNLKGTGDYKIYSADGRLVQEGKLDGQKINVGSLIKGMYVVAIKDEKNTYNMKLMKK